MYVTCGLGLEHKFKLWDTTYNDKSVRYEVGDK